MINILIHDAYFISFFALSGHTAFAFSLKVGHCPITNHKQYCSLN